MWLNVLVTEKDKKKYLPNKIICNQRESLKAYLKFSKNLIFKRKKIDLKNKLPKVSLKSKNILVYPGQHDIFECFNFFTNDKRYINNKIYFKLHPNNKKKIKSNFRNIKIVKNIDYKKKYNIYLSPTTTLVNQFNEKKIKYNLIKFNYKFDLL